MRPVLWNALFSLASLEIVQLSAYICPSQFAAKESGSIFRVWSRREALQQLLQY